MQSIFAWLDGDGSVVAVGLLLVFLGWTERHRLTRFTSWRRP